MYLMFFHLLGLALLEIIFYFYYIGPFEHNVFVKSFGRSINGLIHKKDSTYPDSKIFNNITNYFNDSEFFNSIKQDADNSEKRRIDHNQELFNLTLKYWFICLGLAILITVIYYILKKSKYWNSSNSDREIELVHLTNENNEINEDKYNENNNLSKKKICLKITKYILFGGLVLLFEYIFFQYVVLKYHIITDQQIQYLICEQIN